VVKAGDFLHEKFKGLQPCGCCVTHFKTPFPPHRRNLQWQIGQLRATKKEGLLHAPQWSMKQTLSNSDI